MPQPAGRHLGITVLADHHDRVACQFAGPAATRFDGLDLTHTDDDGAVTIADGIAWFDTTIHAVKRKSRSY